MGILIGDSRCTSSPLKLLCHTVLSVDYRPTLYDAAFTTVHMVQVCFPLPASINFHGLVPGNRKRVQQIHPPEKPKNTPQNLGHPLDSLGCCRMSTALGATRWASCLFRSPPDQATLLTGRSTTPALLLADSYFSFGTGSNSVPRMP